MSSVHICTYENNERTANVSWAKHEGYVVRYHDALEGPDRDKSYHSIDCARRAARRYIKEGSSNERSIKGIMR